MDIEFIGKLYYDKKVTCICHFRLTCFVIVSDARFRKDSYYIESTGVAGPFLVDWVKSNLAYLKAAKKIEGTLKRAEEKKMEVYSRCW